MHVSGHKGRTQTASFNVLVLSLSVPASSGHLPSSDTPWMIGMSCFTLGMPQLILQSGCERV